MTTWVQRATDRYVEVAHENRVSKAEYTKRLETCESCEHLTSETSRCSLCTCTMPKRARFKNFKCPAGKWPIDTPEGPVE